MSQVCYQKLGFAVQELLQGKIAKTHKSGLWNCFSYRGLPYIFEDKINLSRVRKKWAQNLKFNLKHPLTSTTSKGKVRISIQFLHNKVLRIVFFWNFVYDYWDVSGNGDSLQPLKVSRSQNKIVELQILPKWTNKFVRSQCARSDLNKRFLPKPMTTTGWKGTP